MIGAKGEIMYSSPSLFLIILLYPWANSHIFSSEAYCVEVSKYDLWSGFVFKCFIFYLQFSICQHLIHKTSLLDFVFIRLSLFMNVVHSAECLLIITIFYLFIFNVFWIFNFYLVMLDLIIWNLLACNMVFSLKVCLVFSMEYKRIVFFIYFLY